MFQGPDPDTFETESASFFVGVVPKSLSFSFFCPGRSRLAAGAEPKASRREVPPCATLTGSFDPAGRASTSFSDSDELLEISGINFDFLFCEEFVAELRGANAMQWVERTDEVYHLAELVMDRFMSQRTGQPLPRGVARPWARL